MVEPSQVPDPQEDQTAYKEDDGVRTDDWRIWKRVSLGLFVFGGVATIPLVITLLGKQPFEASIKDGWPFVLVVAAWSASLLILEHKLTDMSVDADYFDLLSKASARPLAAQHCADRRKELAKLSSTLKGLGIAGGFVLACLTYYYASRSLTPVQYLVTGSGTVIEGVMANLPPVGPCGGLNPKTFDVGSITAVDTLAYQEPNDRQHAIAFTSSRFAPKSQKDPLFHKSTYIEVFLGWDYVNIIAREGNPIVARGVSVNELASVLLDGGTATWASLGVSENDPLSRKPIQFLVPRGCDPVISSGTCRELSETLLGGAMPNAPISDQRTDPKIKGVVTDLSTMPDGLGIASRLFTASARGVREVRVDGHAALMKRALWGYVAADQDGSSTVIKDKRLLECILSSSTQSYLKYALGLDAPLLPEDARQDQAKWLLGDRVSLGTHYAVRKLAVDGILYALNPGDGDVEKWVGERGFASVLGRDQPAEPPPP